MKLYSLSVLYKGATKSNLLKAAFDLSSFSFFQRSSVQEFMTFTSALIVERTSQGTRASVKEQEYLCHVYVRNDSLGAVVIADTEYPQRVCFTLLDKVLDEFSRQVDSIDWPTGCPEKINYKALDIHLAKYQNPREADAMTKVQAELDETKIILHNTMESLLERGEKLDDLVAKSEHLGNQSKPCCSYLNKKKCKSCSISTKKTSVACVFFYLPSRHGNRTRVVKSCDVSALSCWDVPLSAFLLVLQPPSCISHELFTRTSSQMEHQDESGKGWPVKECRLWIGTDGG
uniref:YKT6 v-SNARE homolog (S. cerevisiae) n=1 Tax=Oryzias sinensis TaxID=183150 RepID=A0A8C7ZXU9_9TELE